MGFGGGNLEFLAGLTLICYPVQFEKLPMVFISLTMDDLEDI
jgi:hypothetical protein